MSFRDNLQHLRATRNMTQEQLAMMVGVSRQSVTKWEAERSYPEMDKLLKLCQIFDCTLDELVQGDLTNREPTPELAVPVASLAEDVTGYDEFYRNYAWRMAAGVSCCILGPAASAALEGHGDGPMSIAMFSFVIAGLALIIPASMESSAFKKAHPYIVNFYSAEQRTASRRTYGMRLAGGIGIILASLALGGFMDQLGDTPMLHALFLVGVAAGVGLIVYGSFMDNRMDIEEYNIDALEDLSEEEIAGIVGEERAPQVLARVRRNKRKGAACGIIMLVATAIALPLLFWGIDSGNRSLISYFWLPLVLGGLMCGVACLAIDMRK